MQPTDPEWLDQLPGPVSLTPRTIAQTGLWLVSYPVLWASDAVF